MQRRLQISSQRVDPLSHILNQSPKLQSTSPRGIQYLSNIWPTVRKILAALDAYQHPGSDLRQYYDDSPGQAFVKWLTPPPSEAEQVFFKFYS